MEPPFVYWKTRSVKKGAALTTLEGVGEIFRMKDGEPVAARFPTNAAFRFDPDFERDTLPVDSFINVEGMLVCSKRLKAFVEERSPAKVEYLPITIYDHTGKALRDAHFIVHLVEPVDCIDFHRSEVTWSASDPSSLLDVEHLEIDASRVPADRLLFRAKGLKSAVILRRDFALELEAAHFQGAAWDEID